MNALLQVAGDVFGPAIIEAVVIIVCFTAVIEVIEIIRDLTNLTQKGGE